MAALQTLRVHVSLVGFEVGQIVIPAIEMKADKSCLSHTDVDEGHQFVKSIRDKLKAGKNRMSANASLTNSSLHGEIRISAIIYLHAI
ncbi:MAG: hypothetical protein DLM72_18280 [Candidatus Nitrosopolaris wilkensis]|nr:MAG: hypothetical protein DLM72_18280 [Candidatus Nitrosopolaris wilkensis]